MTVGAMAGFALARRFGPPFALWFSGDEETARALLVRFCETRVKQQVDTAGRMAHDVDQALHDIVAKEGKMSDEAAAEYVKKLKTDKRYLRDVY